MGTLKQAVFLVGGRGTRLGTLTDSLPKPLLPIGGRPFLDYLIENAVRQGFTDIILLCGYLAETLAQRYAGQGPAGSSIRLVVEPQPAGTGGALLYARDLLDPQFLLSNGDSFFSVDFRGLVAFAANVDAIGTLALRDVAPGRRYGTVSLDAERIVAFHDPAENRPGPMNAGVYLLRREVLDWIGSPPCSNEQQVFPQLAAAGRLRGLVSNGYFIDIGIPEDLQRAQSEIPAMFRENSQLSCAIGASQDPQ